MLSNPAALNTNAAGPSIRRAAGTKKAITSALKVD